MATYTVFGATVPADTDESDGPTEDYGLGTVVQITEPGTITHARWYFPDTAPSEPVVWHVCDLDTLEQLGAHQFVGTGPGWVEEELIAGGENTGHVEIAAPRNVLVWIGTPNRYVYTPNVFTSGGITNGPLTAPASADDPVAIGNGRLGGDRFSPPQGAAGNQTSFFPDMLFETPPPQGVADFPIALTMAGTGEAPAITPNEGAAAIGLSLALAAAGDAPAIDPSEGTAAIGLGLALAAAGDAPAIDPNEGAAAIGLGLALATTGDAPAIDPSEGAAALGLNLVMAGTGFAPDPGDASGTATFTLGLAVAAAGARPSANGQAAFSINLALAGAGDNGAVFRCTPVRSFSEVMP